MGDNVLAKGQAANTPPEKQPTQDYSLIYGNLSDHLIVSLTRCDRDGNLDPDSPVVKGIFADGDKTIESQWQSPFENSNPEQKLPMMMALLQSGQGADTLSAWTQNLPLGKQINAYAQKGVDGLKELEGRTNFNKVNSTQIFLSTQSIRLTASLFFIAIEDAKKEVEQQISLLEQWALPASLSDQSLLQNAELFSGIIPPFVAFTIHGKTYKPFILESVSAPLKAPIDSKGNRLSLTVNLSLISRTAWDASDIIKLYGGQRNADV